MSTSTLSFDITYGAQRPLHLEYPRMDTELCQQTCSNNDIAVICLYGVGQFIKFAKIHETCTLQDLLRHVGIPFNDHTVLKSMSAPNKHFELVVIIGQTAATDMPADNIPSLTQDKHGNNATKSNVETLPKAVVDATIAINSSTISTVMLSVAHSFYDQIHDFKTPIILLNGISPEHRIHHRVRALIMQVNGEHKLISFKLPLGACFMFDLLQQAGVAFDFNTIVQSLSFPGPDFDLVLTVGVCVQDIINQLMADHVQVSNTNESTALATAQDGTLKYTLLKMPTTSVLRPVQPNDFEIPSNILLQNHKAQPHMSRKNPSNGTMLVIFASGFVYFSTFTLLRGSWTVRLLLRAMLIPIDTETIIKCVENPTTEIDFVIAVGFSPTNNELIAMARNYSFTNFPTEIPPNMKVAYAVEWGKTLVLNVAAAASSKVATQVLPQVIATPRLSQNMQETTSTATLTKTTSSFAVKRRVVGDHCAATIPTASALPNLAVKRTTVSDKCALMHPTNYGPHNIVVNRNTVVDKSSLMNPKASGSSSVAVKLTAFGKNCPVSIPTASAAPNVAIKRTTVGGECDLSTPTASGSANIAVKRNSVVVKSALINPTASGSPNVVVKRTAFEDNNAVSITTASGSSNTAVKRTAIFGKSSLSIPTTTVLPNIADKRTTVSDKGVLSIPTNTVTFQASVNNPIYAVPNFELHKISENNFEISTRFVPPKNCSQPNVLKIERNFGRILVLHPTDKKKLLIFKPGTAFKVRDLLKQQNIKFDDNTAIECFATPNNTNHDFVVHVGLTAFGSPDARTHNAHQVPLRKIVPANKASRSIVKVSSLKRKLAQ